MSTSSPLFVNEPATTEIYTLSLHDALPISVREQGVNKMAPDKPRPSGHQRVLHQLPPLSVCQPPSLKSPPEDSKNRDASSRPDRKSTRLSSSHSQISYAVFCLKKKKKTQSS